VTDAADLIARARAALRDDGPNALVDDDMLLSFFNEAQDDLALRLEMDEQTKTGTTSGATLTLPPAATDDPLAELISLDLGAAADDHVEIVSIDDWNYANDNGISRSHTIAYIYDGVLTMYPTPTTGTAYSLRYRGLPPHMVSTSDDWQLPRWTERKAIAYARYQASLVEDRPGIADRYLGEYEQDLPSVPLGRAAKFPGPLRVTIAAGPFDRDTGARHLGRAL
jgi:hypothetical protein